MTPPNLLAGYVPLGIAALLPVLVIWDARVRRTAAARWPGRLQAVLGVGMLGCATGAIVVSVGKLADYSLGTEGARDETVIALIGGEVTLGVLCLPLLLAGLARPARPVSRRGFTTVVLLANLAVVGFGLWYASDVLPAMSASMVAQ